MKTFNYTYPVNVYFGEGSAKTEKRIKLQSEKINEIKFFCGIGYIVALALSACLIKMCFL